MSIKFSDVFNASELNINNPMVEEIINKTKDVAETVGKKSAEHLELSRKKLESLDTKTKLYKMYEKFGKLQYNAYVGEEVDEAELAQLASEISALKDKLDLLNFEIEDFKKDME